MCVMHMSVRTTIPSNCLLMSQKQSLLCIARCFGLCCAVIRFSNQEQDNANISQDCLGQQERRH